MSPSLITGDNDNLVEVTPPENMQHIKGGFYLVRTQAGFRQAFKHYEQEGDIKPSEVHGWPKKYPSLVVFSEGYAGYTFIRAQCIHINKLKDFVLDKSVNDLRQVISGFPGVGKTKACEILKARGVKVLDSDSSTFDKANFPENYLDYIEARIAEGYTLFVSTHDTVRKGLEERGIRHTIVYPREAMKDEYMQRYKERGSPEGFLKLMDSKWEDFIASCKQSRANLHIELSSGRFLGDVLAELG